MIYPVCAKTHIPKIVKHEVNYSIKEERARRKEKMGK
jgi:hypothetical protein